MSQKILKESAVESGKFLLGCMLLQIRQLGVFPIFLVLLDTQAGTNCQIFSLETLFKPTLPGQVQEQRELF